MPSTPSRPSAARLLREYTVYDQAVDVVSCFEFLLTVPQDMAATVTHFERFPKITVTDPKTRKTDTITPDFTVLYTDGTALIGEIARLSLQDNSVEKTCKQILRYDQLTHIPDASGQLSPVKSVDVMQIVPLDVGPDAVDRIITERMLDPDHPYKPQRAPCIVQFARDPDRYMFQRINDPANGHIEGHGRDPDIGERIRKINVKAEYFTSIKSARKFMNDPIKSLYLAVVLYTQTWPTLLRGQSKSFTVDPVATARTLRAQYKTGSADDVRSALGLLESAGLAADNKDGTWNVYAKPPRAKGEHDLARVIAQRSADQARPLVTATRARTRQTQPDEQGRLF